MKQILITSILVLTIASCAKKKEEEDDKATAALVDIPTITAICQQSDYAACKDSGPDLTGNKTLIMLTDSSESVQALQMGSLTCGDQGGSISMACTFTPSDSGWFDQNGAAVTQISEGTYSIQMLVDVNGDVATPADIAKFKNADGDAICFMEVAISSTTTTISGTSATCVIIPASL